MRSGDEDDGRRKQQAVHRGVNRRWEGRRAEAEGEKRADGTGIAVDRVSLV